MIFCEGLNCIECMDSLFNSYRNKKQTCLFFHLSWLTILSYEVTFYHLLLKKSLELASNCYYLLFALFPYMMIFQPFKFLRIFLNGYVNCLFLEIHEFMVKWYATYRPHAVLQTSICYM